MKIKNKLMLMILLSIIPILLSVVIVISMSSITNDFSNLNLDGLNNMQIINYSLIFLQSSALNGASPSGDDYTKATFVINNTASYGNAFSAYTDNGNTSTVTNFFLLGIKNSSYARPILRINDNSTNGGCASIRLDSPNPDIEFVEIDQTSPSGKFEIAVQGDTFQLNSRNTADDSFENYISFNRKAFVASGRILMNMTINSSSATADYIGFLNNAQSAGASNGLIWYNSNANNNLARISVSAGSSYANPIMNFDLNGSRIMNITSLVVTIQSLNITSNFTLPLNLVNCNTDNEGSLFYNKTSHIPMVCNSTRWVNLL